MGPRAGLDAVAKRKTENPCPCRESNPDRAASSQPSFTSSEIYG